MKPALLKFIREGKNPNRLKYNKKFVAFLICFLIATAFWFLISLAKTYTSLVNFPIVYKNLPQNKITVNELPEDLTLELNARGFELLSYHFKFRIPPIEIDLSRTKNYYITKNLVRKITPKFGADVKILTMSPDTIFIQYLETSIKKVPVKLNLSLTFEKQFELSDSIKLSPDSIVISGSKAIIDKIKYWETEKISFSKLNKNISSHVELVTKNFTNDIHLSSTSVDISIPVEQFREGSLQIPVEPINFSKMQKIKIRPQEITVAYFVPLIDYEKVKPDLFRAVVDFSKINKSQGKKTNVQLIKHPLFAKHLRIEPQQVKYSIHN